MKSLLGDRRRKKWAVSPSPTLHCTKWAWKWRSKEQQRLIYYHNINNNNNEVKTWIFSPPLSCHRLQKQPLLETLLSFKTCLRLWKRETECIKNWKEDLWRRDSKLIAIKFVSFQSHGLISLLFGTTLKRGSTRAKLEVFLSLHLRLHLSLYFRVHGCERRCWWTKTNFIDTVTPIFMLSKLQKPKRSKRVHSQKRWNRCQKSRDQLITPTFRDPDFFLLARPL